MRYVLGLLVLLVVASGLVLPRLGKGGGDAPAAGAGAPPAPLPVEVVEVAPRRLAERLATTGTVRPNEEVDVVSEIAGVVEAIQFREGERVERGQPLLALRDDELLAHRDRAQSRLKLAELREARRRELRARGMVSEDDYDVAANELAVLRAELRLAEVQLLKSRIRAPFAGVVGLRRVSVGSLLSPQTRITTVQDIDTVKVDFTLPEKYAGRVGPGDGIDFRVRGTERLWQAEVYAVEPRIDQETRSLTLRARAANPDRLLTPGAFADISVEVGEMAAALVVPSLAVVPELGGKKVFVVEDGKAAPRRIETGIRGENEVEVTSGLAPGDRVIVSAIQRLRPGLPVAAVAPAGTGRATP